MLFLNLLFLFVCLPNGTPETVASNTYMNYGPTTEYPGHTRKLSKKEPQTPNLISNSDSLTYSAAKYQIGEMRTRLVYDLKEKRIELDSVKEIFADQLVNKIIPFWYGTAWSFGGHTAIPGRGKIACGYFVSTTLRDMGLKLNRYKLAQKSPIDEALAISCGTEITTIEEDDYDNTLTKIDSLVQKGIYFIGFDTGHVGFLVKKNGVLFLIHSNYLLPISVCIEPLKNARVFKKFTKFHLVDVSHNDLLIKKWLSGEVVL